MNLVFLAPLFLIGIAAVALPVVFHLISGKKAVRIRFSAVAFLLPSSVRSRRRSRLVDILLLVLRCAALVFLALAFARPSHLTASLLGTDEPMAVAVVVDNSLSMGYGDNFKRALGEAKRVLGEIPDGSFVLVAPLVGYGVESLLLTEKSDALSKLGEIALTNSYTDNVGRIEEVYTALQEAPREKREVVFITDLQRSGWRIKPRYDWLRFIDVSEEKRPGNMAVTSVDVEVADAYARIGAVVSNFGEAEAKGVVVTLGLGDIEINRVLDLGPLTASKVEFTVPALGFPEGDVAGRVSIGGDKLPADDTRYFIIPGRRKPGILVVDGDMRGDPRSSETFYLTRALEAVGEETSLSYVVRDGESFLTEDLSRYDSVFIANVGFLDSAAVEGIVRFLGGGGKLFVFLGDRINGALYNALLGDILPGEIGVATDEDSGVRVSDQGALAGLLRGSLGGARIKRYFLIRPRDGVETLLETESGSPLLIHRGVGGGEVYLFASTADTNWNTLPLSTAFLPMINKLLDLGRRDALSKRELKVGEPMSPSILGRAKPSRIVIPGGREINPVEGGSLFVETHVPGVYEVVWDDGSRFLFAVNVDPKESDLAKLSLGEGGGAARAEASVTWRYRELFPYFLWVSLVLVTSEAAACFFTRGGRPTR